MWRLVVARGSPGCRVISTHSLPILTRVVVSEGRRKTDFITARARRLAIRVAIRANTAESAGPMVKRSVVVTSAAHPCSRPARRSHRAASRRSQCPASRLRLSGYRVNSCDPVVRSSDPPLGAVSESSSRTGLLPGGVPRQWIVNARALPTLSVELSCARPSDERQPLCCREHQHWSCWVLAVTHQGRACVKPRNFNACARVVAICRLPPRDGSLVVLHGCLSSYYLRARLTSCAIKAALSVASREWLRSSSNSVARRATTIWSSITCPPTAYS